jgi:hypothetical protein
MKKALAILLCAAAAGSFAFADDAAPTVTAKFNTNVYTGVNYSAGSNTLSLGDRDNFDPNTSRIDFKGALAYGSDLGVKFTLRTQTYSASNFADSYKTTYFTIRRAFAYANFFDSKVQLQAGRVGNADFCTSYNGLVAFDNADIGAVVTAKPVEGLELGYLLPVTSTSTDAGAAFTKSVIAASYAIPSIATIQVWAKNFNAVEIIGDVAVTAVKDLTLSGEWDYTPTSLSLTEQVAYPVDKFSPSIACSESLASSKLSSLSLSPSVSYAYTDKLSFGADYSLSLDSSFAATHVIDAYAKYDLGKGYLKFKPGYDTTTGNGFFVGLILDATL